MGVISDVVLDGLQHLIGCHVLREASLRLQGDPHVLLDHLLVPGPDVVGEEAGIDPVLATGQHCGV